MIEGISPGGKPLREIYEARNHHLALLEIERRAAKANRFTEEDLLTTHRIVLTDINPIAAGRLRDQRVLIVGSSHVPPENHKFPQLIPMLLEFANDSRVNPLLRAAELHYNLAAVHPFLDGNGRTSRLAMNHLLLMNGYPLTYFEVENRQEYLESLDAADRGDLAPFASLVLNRVEFSMRYLADA